MNIKTILFAALASSVAANELRLKVNVDDAYSIMLDGVPVNGYTNSWNAVQEWKADVAQKHKPVLTLTAIDFGGGYRASVEINDEGTKRTDWRCTGEYNNRNPDKAFQPTNGLANYGQPAGQGNSSSINKGDAFWADGFGQKSTASCVYTGSLLDIYENTNPITLEMVEALRADLKAARDNNADSEESNHFLKQSMDDLKEELAHNIGQLHEKNEGLSGHITDTQADIAQLEQVLEKLGADHVANLLEIESKMVDNLDKLEAEFDDEIERQNDILISQMEDHASIMDACYAHKQDADQIICAHINMDQHTAEVEVDGHYENPQ